MRLTARVVCTAALADAATRAASSPAPPLRLRRPGPPAPCLGAPGKRAATRRR